MATRQQLEQQLVAAHRSGNVQAAQQAAYAIRQYDQNSLYAQVPSVNAPPPIERVPKPTFGDYLGDLSYGLGKGFTSQLEGVETLIQHPIESGKALIQAGVEAVRNPAKAIGEAWSGIKSQAQTAMSSPQGFGQVLGENIDFIPGPGGKRRTPTQAELDVYHGTPHTFEPEEGAPLGKFRSSKIGTGEGAQAYGYGLYFAEDSNVAGSYKTTLSTRDKNRITLDGQRIDPDTMFGRSLEDLKKLGRQSALQKLDDNIRFNEKYAPDMAELYRSVRNKIDTIDESKVSVKEGSLYKVDLPDAKIEQMLDWDKPLSEQPQIVNRLRKIADEIPGFDEMLQPFELESTTGETINNYLSRMLSSHDASKVLQNAGIPGIKYLDAGSRDGGKGTRNFVVFPGEEQHLTILERN